MEFSRINKNDLALLPPIELFNVFRNSCHAGGYGGGQIGKKY